MYSPAWGNIHVKWMHWSLRLPPPSPTSSVKYATSWLQKRFFEGGFFETRGSGKRPERWVPKSHWQWARAWQKDRRILLDKAKWCNHDLVYIYIYTYYIPVSPLFCCLNPPKQGHFFSNQNSRVPIWDDQVPRLKQLGSYGSAQQLALHVRSTLPARNELGYRYPPPVTKPRNERMTPEKWWVGRRSFLILTSDLYNG